MKIKNILILLGIVSIGIVTIPSQWYLVGPGFSSVIDADDEGISRFATPEVVEELTPEVVEELTPEVVEELTPEVVEELTPEVVQEPTPEVVQEPTPEVNGGSLFAGNIAGVRDIGGESGGSSLAWVLLIAVVLLIGGGAFFFFQKKRSMLAIAPVESATAVMPVVSNPASTNVDEPVSVVVEPVSTNVDEQMPMPVSVVVEPPVPGSNGQNPFVDAYLKVLNEQQ